MKRVTEYPARVLEGKQEPRYPSCSLQVVLLRLGPESERHFWQALAPELGAMLRSGHGLQVEVLADPPLAVRAPPSADRRPVHQRLGTPAQSPERRPISERLTVPVQGERVRVADRLGPTNRSNLQNRLGTPNPSPPTGPIESSPGHRLLALAAETEDREAIELGSQLEGFPSPTLAPRSRVRVRSRYPDESAQPKRSRFDQPLADSSALGAELLYISAQRRLQQLQLIAKTWGLHCDDPDNICLGRSRDLSWMENIQAEIAEAEATNDPSEEVVHNFYFSRHYGCDFDLHPDGLPEVALGRLIFFAFVFSTNNFLAFGVERRGAKQSRNRGSAAAQPKGLVRCVKH
ncbi:hypothetical protein KFL_003710080 [Klebsormidium nitens]|uniref:Uncharacterized protein n=1 Tax=Klebsormidium nitens TaxID=105231 RepID=A0A1Y1ICL8_KLENI|nr:hypothetical protein KFL_003710080 [Klebsormidium nitens]|eukprot:GAQ87702.1 hypothetical protein KFL_003710080 [Klebsormidium nitens]